MISSALHLLAAGVLKRPARVLALTIIPLAASIWALGVPLDFSFASVMDRSHPEVARYFEASDRFGLGRLLPALLEGPEEVLDEAALALRLALDDLDAVDTVAGAPPREWLLGHAPYLVPTEDFRRWLALADADPEAAETEREVRALRAGLARLEGELGSAPAEGARALLITMSSDPFELALDAPAFPEIRETARRALTPFGVNVRFAGMSAIITQEQEATIARMSVLGPISLLLVLLLLRSVERSTWMLLAVLGPMLLAVGTTLAIIGATAGELTLMEAVFGVLVFGLGIDFAIHLLLRLREEQRRGADLDLALLRAIGGTGRGIVAGAITTSGAFLLLCLAPDPVFQRLGLAGGLGLLLCVVFFLTLLPAQWKLLGRRACPTSHDAHPAPHRISWIEGIVAGACRSPGATLMGASLVLGIAAVGLADVRYETNLERVFSRDIEAVRTAERIHERFGLDPGPWLVATSGPDEARRVSEALAEDPIFARTQSLASFLPPDLEARQRALQRLAPRLARALRAERIAADVEASGWRADRAALLDALLRADALGPPTLERLPGGLRERLLGPEGEWLVYAFVAEPALDSAVAARQRAAAQAVAPGATSINAIYEALIGTERPWMPRVVATVLLFIVTILWLDTGNLRLTAIALAPVVFAGIVTAGAMGLMGIAFNTVTLVAIPLLLGIGVDDGVHIIHRMLEEPDRPMQEVVARVGEPILMTTLTTSGSVGLLVFTRHPGIESLAVVLLMGLTTCFLASITILPAAASLLARIMIRRRIAHPG